MYTKTLTIMINISGSADTVDEVNAGFEADGQARTSNDQTNNFSHSEVVARPVQGQSRS